MELKKYLNDSGWLPVGDGHKIYWEDWGNPKAKVPILYLHGGPGGGNRPTNILPFDLTRQRVILHDQRGSGKSRPFGSIKNNTTQDLISDINKLRGRLKIGQVSLWGGSWGSTLALSYAIVNPEVVVKMLLWGIYLGRAKDNQFLFKWASQHFPDIIDRLMKLVPVARQNEPEKYLFTKIKSAASAQKIKLLSEYRVFESALVSLDSQPDKLALEAGEWDLKGLKPTLIELHYMANNCFLPDNHILSNTAKLQGIPTVIVHGRFDFVCSPAAAFELQAALGESANLHLVTSGHARDAVLREVLKAYSRAFL